VKYLLVALLAAGAFFFTTAPSFADNSFFIELGNDVPQSDAAKQWDELAHKYKAMLGHLKYYPKAVGSTANVRIQAGPIADKDKAQKICTRLFKENVACFVIEGVGDTPPTSVMNLSEESMNRPVKVVQLPWLGNSNETMPIASVPTPAPAPQAPEVLTSVSDEAVKPQLETSNRQAEVQVAEAIRVPLTQSEDQQQNAEVTVKSLPDLKSPFASAHGGDGKYADESDDSGAGWLSVTSFPNEEIAASFWEEIRHAAPKQAKKLRVRILSPLLASGGAHISLNVGPFASSSEAYNFCRQGIQAKERGLTCSFTTAMPGDDASHVERRRPVENPVAMTYWIQIGAAQSQEEAMQQLEDISSKNEDLIKGLRSSVAPSSTDAGSYIVRVGPITNHDEAIQSCSRMQDRGIDCRVISFAATKS